MSQIREYVLKTPIIIQTKVKKFLKKAKQKTEFVDNDKRKKDCMDAMIKFKEEL